MASLPPYETLVRWTVIDTTKWLNENGFGDFRDSFRKEGVDGSKLAKLTDSDIDNFKVSSPKKRIQLKNAVANIDRSRVNSLPRTQGMMSAFRRNEEPAPPPRPPRARQPLPSKPDPEPPLSHAPAPPSHQPHNDFDDDNEDAYSWGEDFYQSDPEDHDDLDDYVNDKEWPEHDQNRNNIGYERQPTYEDIDSGDGGNEEFYEQPANSPSQITGGGIVEQLQRELTRRGTGSKGRPAHLPESHDSEDDDEDYELPLADPPAPEVPARPPKPGQQKPAAHKPREPPPREKSPLRSKPLPRAPLPIPPPIDDVEQVYEEPCDEETEKAERARNKKSAEKKKITSRQLPPVPSPGHVTEDKALPTPRQTGQRPPLPKLPTPKEEDYQSMQAPQRTMTSRVDQSKSKPHPAQRSSRPLPHVPTPTDSPVKKVPSRSPMVPPVSQRDELDRYDWYHKTIDRTTAESFLIDQQEDGMYLIRKSKRGGTEQQYTLTIFKQDRVYNLPIRKRERDGKFALGAPKPNELDFETVPNLVDYFKTKLIMLNPKAKNSSSGSTRLVIPMPK